MIINHSVDDYHPLCGRSAYINIKFSTKTQLPAYFSITKIFILFRQTTSCRDRSKSFLSLSQKNHFHRSEEIISFLFRFQEGFREMTREQFFMPFRTSQAPLIISSPESLANNSFWIFFASVLVSFIF
jgi:hypothetical protein